MGPSAALSNALKPAEGAGEGFSQQVCRPFLLEAQNPDGGWGYRPTAQSAIEPTAWALLALGKTEKRSDAIERGLAWLLGCQNADGAWPSRPQTIEGSWVTSLAALALGALEGPKPAIAAAAGWICQRHSGERAFRMRLARLIPRKKVVEQDLSLEGWSWTPGTSSWVEPTAASLVFLHHLPSEMAPAEAVERRRMGETLLYDRMCQPGGWNSGNPKIYGVSGIPQIGPTAWALIALQEYAGREENRRSLDWLAANFDSIRGPSSVALAQIALEASGRPKPSIEGTLAAQFASHGFLRSVLAISQAAFALGPGPDVLRWFSKR